MKSFLAFFILSLLSFARFSLAGDDDDDGGPSADALEDPPKEPEAWYRIQGVRMDVNKLPTTSKSPDGGGSGWQVAWPQPRCLGATKCTTDADCVKGDEKGMFLQVEYVTNRMKKYEKTGGKRFWAEPCTTCNTDNAWRTITDVVGWTTPGPREGYCQPDKELAGVNAKASAQRHMNKIMGVGHQPRGVRMARTLQ